MKDESDLTDARPTDLDGGDEDLRLAEILEGFLADLGRGVTPDRQALLAQYPDLADQLTSCLDGLEVAQRMGVQLREHSTAGSEHTTASIPEQFGDFRIIRELGRGGMGVVYLAEQVSLHRQVALKMMPLAAMMDPRQLLRFKNEVQAVALLQHTNIVPVYSVGNERGVHYYTMQYIEGHTLADVIVHLRRLAGLDADDQHAADDDGKQRRINQALTCVFQPSPPAHESHNTVRGELGQSDLLRDSPTVETNPMAALSTTFSSGPKAERFRGIARLMIQAAEALDHAHTRGVLHRDVKPGNLMVDTTGNLWITDFGLAHLEGEAGMTMTGDIVGTLRYMSPEQALGKRAILDQRADIYSLGATFYELLCLEPIFANRDRQALLNQIAWEEPCPPSRIDKSIPRDLGTIVLKAIHKNTSARYLTAQEMADDLKRYMDSKPLHARRPNLIDYLGKWSRRHRTLVWAAMAVLVATTLVSIIGALLLSDAYRREKGQRLLAEEMKHQANQHAERAEQLVYAADMRLAGLAWRNQDVRQVRELLGRHIPTSSQLDRRGYEWHFLDRESNGNVQKLASTADPLYQVTYSPDGRWLATAGEDGRVRVFDANSGQLKDVLDTGQGEVNCVRFAAEGKMFATTGDDGSIKIWRFDNRQLLTTIPAYQKQAYDVCFSPDQTLLASCGHDPVIRLWDPYSGESRGNLEGHTRTVEKIAISPDGSWLASASSDGLAQIWHLATRTVRHMLPHGGMRVLSVAFAPNGKWLLTTGIDKTMHSWDVGTGEKLNLFPDFKHRDEIRSVAISSDMRWVAIGDDVGSLLLWNLPKNLSMGDAQLARLRMSWQAIKMHTGRVYGLAFSPDVSRLASVGEDGNLMQLQPKGIKSLFTARQKPSGIVDVEPVAHRDMVVTAGEQGVHLISLSTGEILHEFDGPDPSWHRVALSADVQRVAANKGPGKITVWDLLSRERVQSFDLNTDVPGDLAISPAGELLATLIDHNLVLMDVETGQWRLPEFGKQTATVEFSPNGTHLALARHETNDVEIWDWHQEAHIHTFPGYGSVIYKTTFGPLGRLLAAVDTSRRLIVWDLEQDVALFSTVTHDDRINDTVFTPDRRSLITYSNDGCMRLWHLATGGRLFDLVELPHEQIMRAVVACDGQYLCYVGEQERLLRVAPGCNSEKASLLDMGRESPMGSKIRGEHETADDSFSQ